MSKQSHTAVALSLVLGTIVVVISSATVADVLNDALVGVQSIWSQLESELIRRTV